MNEALTLLIETQNLQLLGAELWLAVGAMALLMFGVFAGERSSAQVTGLSIAVLTAALVWLFFTGERGDAMNGAFVLDDFAWFMKLLTLFGSIIALIMSVNYLKIEGLTNFEFPVLVMIDQHYARMQEAFWKNWWNLPPKRLQSSRSCFEPSPRVGWLSRRIKVM